MTDVHLYGKYEVRSWGLPPMGYDELARTMQERYGVTVHRVASCQIEGSVRRYAAAYNSVSVAAAIRAHGRNIFQEAALSRAPHNAERNRDAASFPRSPTSPIGPVHVGHP
jgi:predicted transcriptional regulator